ncbi:hypothetical protein V2J09_004677 [Rumex salicifolius]
MATNARDARRRRILQGGQDRLNLITGRVQNISSTDSQSTIPDISVASDEDTYTAGRAQSPPLVSQDLDPMPHHPPDKSTDDIVSGHDQAVESIQNDSYNPLIREEPSLRRRGTGNDISRVSSSEVRGISEPASATWNQPNHVSLPEQLLASLLNLLGSVRSQQLNTAISATEQTRRVLSMTMSLVVLLCYFGFPILGNKIIRSIIVFRPLFFLLLMNVSLVTLRLLAELEPRKKDAGKLSESEGISWAVEAGRALELGLMLQNVMGSLFMDVSLYALIIVCGFCLAN